MTARIFKPARTAMQSGSARTREWVLEFEPASAREVDPLMGWISSGDTNTQVSLEFETRDEAIAYATRNGIGFTVVEPAPHKQQSKSYSDNFKFGRLGLWTH